MSHLLRSTQVLAHVESIKAGVAQYNVSLQQVGDIEIPLPPLEVQKEIVAEIEGYQKVIDGARAVLDNYRPHIPIHPDWPVVELGGLVEINNGYVLTEFSPNGAIACIKVGDMNLKENQMHGNNSSGCNSFASEVPF